MNTQKKSEIHQPVSVDRHAQGEPSVKEKNLTANPGTDCTKKKRAANRAGIAIGGGLVGAAIGGLLGRLVGGVGGVFVGAVAGNDSW